MRKMVCYGMFFILPLLFSSCATIIGGSRYNAKVLVPDHPDAKIEYQGVFQGTGEASFKALRKNANSFSVTIKKEGCKTEVKEFRGRAFRGWAFLGTLVTWTGIIGGIPVPWGVIVDGATGSWWKPDVSERGVFKQDYKHYNYTVNYTGCGNSTPTFNNHSESVDSLAKRLKDLKELYDQGVLTEEEYKSAKKNIIEKE